jgi:hypothetical protein
MSRRWTLSRPRAWADALDFVGPRVRTASWSWTLLLAGVVAVAWVVPQVNQAEQALVDAQADLKRLQRAAHQQKLAQTAPVRPDAKADQAPALGSESARQAAQLAQWLGYPWMTTLSGLEEAAKAEHAVMLSLSLDVASLGARPDAWPEAHLGAAVTDDAAALRWVQAQGPSAQLVSRERLSTPFAVGSANYGWRVEAVVAGGAP